MLSFTRTFDKNIPNFGRMKDFELHKKIIKILNLLYGFSEEFGTFFVKATFFVDVILVLKNDV